MNASEIVAVCFVCHLLFLARVVWNGIDLTLAVSFSKTFLQSLPLTATDQSLHGAFDQSAPGSVVDAKVIMDRYTGRSRGFGFVTFSSTDAANNALQQMNGAEVDGRAVRVDMASSSNRQ
jgi:RNA recognition motif-containing protein